MALFGRKKPVLGRIKKTQREVSFTRQFFRGLFRIVVVLGVIALVWYGTRLEMFTIREVHIQGGETISHDEVRARITDELQGAYFLIIPKRFSYLYPHDRLLVVTEKIPRIHNITIERDSRTLLNVTFEEYMPHALWCIQGKDTEPCYFIDAHGYAFTEAPLLHGGSLIRHSIEGIEQITEGSVIDEGMLSAIDSFTSRAGEELGLRIATVVHKQNKDFEFLVSGGGKIYIASEKDMNSTFENLKSVLTSDGFKHIAPGNFQYIDVRFDNKVFVNEEPEQVATTTATTTLPE